MLVLAKDIVGSSQKLYVADFKVRLFQALPCSSFGKGFAIFKMPAGAL